MIPRAYTTLLTVIINHDESNKSGNRCRAPSTRRAFHPREPNALHPALRAHPFESRSLLNPEIQSAWTGGGHRLPAHVRSLASALYPSEESGLLDLGHKCFPQMGF